MMPFGHVGISLGVGWVAERAGQEVASGPFRVSRWMVALGAFLPDLVDKPLAGLAPEVFTSTRTLAHSMLFNLVILSVALLLIRRYGWTAPLTVALASAGHLVLDSLWTEPRVVLWPLYGLAFSGHATDLGLGALLDRLLDPFEFLGLIVLVLLLIEHLIKVRAGAAPAVPRSPMAVWRHATRMGTRAGPSGGTRDAGLPVAGTAGRNTHLQKR